MSCECYQIGGPFIAEDPDCPAHGTEAQRRRATSFSEYWSSLDYETRQRISSMPVFNQLEFAFEAGKDLS